MAVTRRMGSKDSETSNLIMDITEDILRDYGISYLTSRNITDRMNSNQRLVFYYFENMEDLIVETFRRMARRELERLKGALASKHALRELWEILVVTLDTRLVSEYITIANRNEKLREEVRAHVVQVRGLQEAAISRMTQGNADGDRAIPAVAIAMLATSSALSLHREAGIGVTEGHKEVLALITDFIERYDPIRGA